MSDGGDPISTQELYARYLRTRAAIVAAAGRPGPIPRKLAMEQVGATEIYIDYSA
jgi:hypothetical protein